jgi:hypothetical protein
MGVAGEPQAPPAGRAHHRRHVVDAEDQGPVGGRTAVQRAGQLTTLAGQQERVAVGPGGVAHPEPTAAGHVQGTEESAAGERPGDFS